MDNLNIKGIEKINNDLIEFMKDRNDINYKFKPIYKLLVHLSNEVLRLNKIIESKEV